MIDKNELKRLAEAFPDDLDWDSNTEPFFNGPSGESLGGGSTGYYCVYGAPFEIDGEQYDGHTYVEICKADFAKFMVAAREGVLSLLSEIEGLHAQHGRDSAEMRNLCQARDDARKERDQLNAENERLKNRTDWQAECLKRGFKYVREPDDHYVLADVPEMADVLGALLGVEVRSNENDSYEEANSRLSEQIEGLTNTIHSLESLRKDAERYRWLRDGAGYCDTRDIPGMAPARMDEFIDSAMSKGDKA